MGRRGRAHAIYLWEYFHPRRETPLCGSSLKFNASLQNGIQSCVESASFAGSIPRAAA